MSVCGRDLNMISNFILYYIFVEGLRLDLTQVGRSVQILHQTSSIELEDSWIRILFKHFFFFPSNSLRLPLTSYIVGL